MRPAYYNEFDPFAAQWLRNLISAGHLPPGDVDDRSIVDVRPADLAGYGQCHFFAGIGGFALACRLAGWPDDKPIWTGGFPCQPFSVAGRQLAQADERHLWPVLHGLIAQGRPSVFLGENVAGIIPLALDGVLFDLESSGYASRAFVVPACAVNAPHRRDRVWIAAKHMADANGLGPQGAEPTQPQARGRRLADGDGALAVADADQPRPGEEWQQRGGELGRAGGDPGTPDRGDALADTRGTRLPLGEQRGEPRAAERGERPRAATRERGGAWSDAAWLTGRDGKARRVEPGVRLLAHGIPGRVGRLRAYGNAIVPQVAAEIIRALRETECTTGPA